jgi:uncharacterized membrane protein YphA (DoxX/SURF4 family)
MRFRDHVALTLPALILRLVLCLTFLWAGVGKIVGEFTVTGNDAARLAQMGVALEAVEPAPAPLRILPDADQPAERTPPTDLPPPSDLIIPNADPGADASDQPEQAPQPTTEDNTESTPESKPAADAQPSPSTWANNQVAGTTYSPEDFPGNYRVQRVAGIALLLSKAGNPGLDAQSNPIRATMPAWAAAGRWPMHFAWAAAITELLAAFLLFFGVLTRLGGAMLMGVMLTAMWLTQFGPAFVDLSPSYLGFIPAAADPWAPASYATLLWQLACFAMAAAIFMLGSGPIGFDRALFRPAERLERSADAKRERTTFDRGPNETP